MSVAIALVRALLEVVERSGVSRQAFLRRAKIPEARLNDGSERLSLEAFASIQQLAVELTGDEAFGLHLGEYTTDAAFDLLGHLVSHAPTAGFLLVTACAHDSAVPGYDDPFLTNVPAAGSGGAAAPESDNGRTTRSTPSSETGAGSAATSPPTTDAPASSSPPVTSGSATSTAASASGATPDPDCDLSGRWMATEHTVDEALGARQLQRHWMYFEFSQTAERVIATRGVDCGWDVVPLNPLAGSADLHKAWPSIMTKVPMAGRKATVKRVASGCSVAFDPYVGVYAVTTAYYGDTSHAMPGPSDAASGGTPGWEDWDSDGNPGITYNISGVASGQVYAAARNTNTWSGTIERTGSGFTIPDVTKHDNTLLGYNGTPLLTTQSTVAADASLHFVQLARLDSTQAVGDDAATCNAVRALASTLTPKADENPLK